MRVFITGGSGWVGSGVIRELLAAGHVVTALARNAETAKRLTAAGVTPRLGDITDLSGLRAAAKDADAVIHCAFNHKFGGSDLFGGILVRITGSPWFARLSRAGGTDIRAIEALLQGLESGSSKSKVFVCSAPVASLLTGRVVTEKDLADTKALGAIRVASERMVMAAARRGIRSAVIRLPISVHGVGDAGFVSTLFDTARKTGVSAYLGNGENRWPAVHRDDAAALYRLAIEGLASGKVPAGSALHAVADEGIPFRQLAQAIADEVKLGPPEPRKNKHFGFLAMFMAMDNPASSAITQRLTGWRPTRPGLLEDVHAGAYATAAAQLSTGMPERAAAH